MNKLNFDLINSLESKDYRIIIGINVNKDKKGNSKLVATMNIFMYGKNYYLLKKQLIKKIFKSIK